MNTLELKLSAVDNARDTWLERFDALLEREDAPRIQAFRWDTPTAQVELVIEVMTRAAPRLTGLRALEFRGINDQELELGDVTPLLLAYPHLETLRIHAQGVELGRVQHEHLRELEVNATQVSSAFVEGLLGSNLPALETLSLCLGEWSLDQNLAFQLLYTEDVFPKLETLRLKNASLANALVEGLANSPLLEHITELDFSQGAFSDDGARALLNSSRLNSLRKIILEQHFVSDGVLEKLREFLQSKNIEFLETRAQETRARGIAVRE
jgi:hypothetical protein